MERADPSISYHGDDVLDFQASAYRYPGRAGQAVRHLKYNRRTGLAAFMADSVLSVADQEGFDCDHTVPIPIHWFRLATRGFNQAELIASRFPNRLFALRRIRPTKPQAGLTTSERLKNLDGAFEAVTDVKDKTILLIDDVVTSGQTARECAKALRQAGAKQVGILAFCGDI
jgi:ComF family protein